MPQRTDIALDTHESLGGEINGVSLKTHSVGDIKISTVEVLDEEGKRTIGREKGKYITVESHAVARGDRQEEELTAKLLAKEIKGLISRDELKKGVLVVGLGNRHVTADSLGPSVCDKLFVTRHIHKYAPEAIDNRINDISAIAPGVLGITGIETGEIIEGLTKKTNPGLVIAIDSLASSNVSRIRTTFQLSNTGISPGSGIGNRRKAIDEETLNVKVLGIGVPLVVFAATIAEALILQSMEAEGLTQDISPELQELIEKVSSSEGAEMIVTPKDIDAVVEGCARVIANALNIALHENISLDDVKTYMS